MTGALSQQLCKRWMKTTFDDSIPSQLQCPIALNSMEDLVAAADTCERRSLEQWFKNQDSAKPLSPLTGGPNCPLHFFPVHACITMCCDCMPCRATRSTVDLRLEMTIQLSSCVNALSGLKSVLQQFAEHHGRSNCMKKAAIMGQAVECMLPRELQARHGRSRFSSLSKQPPFVDAGRLTGPISGCQAHANSRTLLSVCQKRATSFVASTRQMQTRNLFVRNKASILSMANRAHLVNSKLRHVASCHHHISHCFVVVLMSDSKSAVFRNSMQWTPSHNNMPSPDFISND